VETGESRGESIILERSQAKQKISDIISIERSKSNIDYATYRLGLSSRDGHQGDEDCHKERKLGHDDVDDDGDVDVDD
jgi:hypothetical protein